MLNLSYKYAEGFKTVPYENKGMFNSELLSIISIAKEFDLRIIESGTGRGHSTETIALNGLEIVSIDHASNEDTKFARERLKDYENVTLINGDSRELIFDHLSEPCLVLIDGPKGEVAIDFADKLFECPGVRFIAIHDLYKPNPHRDLVEEKFITSCTDDQDFVDDFSYMDRECWDVLKKINGIPERPYSRRGKKIDSYASTLAILISRR